MSRIDNEPTWRTLPRNQFGPIDGQVGAGPRVLRGLALLVLILSAGWLLWTLVRPLPAPERSMAREPTPIAPTPSQHDTTQVRVATLVRLAETNRFNADGLAWANESDAPPLAHEPPADEILVHEPELALVSHSPSPVESVSAAEFIDLPPVSAELAEALKAIELRGLHLDRGGNPVAMVGFVHSKTRAQSRSVREGEDFAAPEAPAEDSWRMERIDLRRARVVVSRGGEEASLALFTMTSGRDGGAVAPRIVSAREAQIRAELEASGLGEAQIEAVLLAMRDPARAGAARELASLAQPIDQSSAQSESQPIQGPPEMPEALQQLLARMAKQTARAGADEELER